MPNPDTRYGLTGGPDLRLCDGDGSEDKLLGLNAAGDITLEGSRIGDCDVLLSSQVASASSSIDFTSTHITSTYDVYRLEIEGLVTATDAVNLHLLVSNDGGSTWEADANEYVYTSKQRRSGGSDINLNSNGDTKLILNTRTLSSVAAEGFSCSIKMYGAARAAAMTVFGGTVHYYESTSDVVIGAWAGGHETAEVVDGLRVIAAAGNLTSGRVSLYGVKHE